jgi:dTDP-4-dehydrorhamnose 3,5-epimerase-like enzyme
MTADFLEKSIYEDKRGKHIKLFGKTPEKLAVPDFTVHEVFMTQNYAGVLRGMHFQVNPAQPKLLSCVTGSALVNVVCLDRKSPDYLLSERVLLSGDSQIFLHVPAEHALGYLTFEEDTRMLYLAGSDFNAEGDVGIDPFDPDLSLDWGGTKRESVILSARDENLPSLEKYLEGVVQ